MRFVVIAEGQSEGAGLGGFLREWLNARLPKRVGVAVQPLKGKDHFLDKIAPTARLLLNGRRADDIIAVIGLLDLHGLKAPEHLTTVAERVRHHRDDIEARVGHPKFRQRFAVHETEAWFLAVPEILPDEVAKAIPPHARSHPERVDSDSPPAKLLERLYRERRKETYRKTTHTADLLTKLPTTPGAQAEGMTAKCPYLRELLDELVSLACSAA